MTAVAVWAEKPTPEALLEDRLDRGWRPLPSALAEGPAVLGFAAKVPIAQWAS